MKEKILEILTGIIDELLAEADAAAGNKIVPQLTVPKDKSHGDFATNAAMVIAKRINKNPRETAEIIKEKLNEKLVGTASAEIAGPGFINFKLSGDAGAEIFKQLFIKGEEIGFSDSATGKKVNVEYVSANPTGPLSVGHGRNAAVGDVVASLYEAVGYDVTREYYFNDAGNQMTVLANSVKTRYLQLLGIDAKLDENAYQGEYIIDVAKTIYEEHGDSLKETTELDLFKKYAVDAMFDMIKKSLEKMRVKHDVYFNERSLYADGKIEETLKKIASLGLSYEKDGAVWFKAEQFGAEKDRVLVKSNGEPTYRLPDIAYHVEKMKRGYDLIVDIFGADHQAQYPDVIACLKAMGFDAEKIKVVIYQFVTIVQNGEAVKMSTRKANYITLDELIDDVGVDATRYFFVMRRLGSHLEFDIELARKHSLDNPVFYVQYAHARISSIFRHAAEKKPEISLEKIRAENIKPELLNEQEEQDLISHIAQFDELILTAAKTCEPHRLTGYLEKLAELFHRYYNLHHVVVDDDKLTLARLALVIMTQRVIRNGLQILGVSAPEKM